MRTCCAAKDRVDIVLLISIKLSNCVFGQFYSQAESQLWQEKIPATSETHILFQSAKSHPGLKAREPPHCNFLHLRGDILSCAYLYAEPNAEKISVRCETVRREGLNPGIFLFVPIVHPSWATSYLFSGLKAASAFGSGTTHHLIPLKAFIINS